MTWSATQVGPRRVESCLGGHEEGVDRGRRLGEEGAAPVTKTGTNGLSERVSVSGLTGVGTILLVTNETEWMI